jgi:hypothetical protein
MSSSSVLNRCPAKNEGMKRKRFFTQCLTRMSRIMDFIFEIWLFTKSWTVQDVPVVALLSAVGEVLVVEVVVDVDSMLLLPNVL